MAKTSITIIMYTMYTISSCYNNFNGYEENEPEKVNTTTLYPVNITIEDLKQQESKNKNNVILEQHDNRINNHNYNIIKQQSSKNNNENILKLHQSEENKIIKTQNHNREHAVDKKQEINNDTNESEEIVITDSQFKDDKVSEDEEKPSDVKTNTESNNVKNDITTWSLETNYSKNEKDNFKGSKEDQEKIVKEFRPSPHLGSFFDKDAFALTTEASLYPWSPAFRKPSSFISSPQDFYKLNYKKPIDEPYKYDTNIFQDPAYWKHHTGLESKPTDSVPVKIPAGGLYKSPGVLKERPIIESNEDFGLKFKDEKKESSLKKGVNPWKSFLHLATALLPVGLIVSALTPSIITLQSTENNPYYPNRVTRRVDNFKNLPQISEGCKRRLLCEIHSGNLVNHQSSSTGHKHCYKVQCEDPQAMMKVLRWVLTHRPQLHNNPLSDDRGRFT